MYKLFYALFALGLFLQSSITYATTPLLMMETGGGFVSPDHRGWGEKLSIYPNGKVISSYRPNDDTAWDNLWIATLPTEVVATITNKINGIQPGQLVFPDDPECTDVPVTTYSAKNGQGTLVDFAKSEACRLGFLETFEKSMALKTLLDGLQSLANAYHGLDG